MTYVHQWGKMNFCALRPCFIDHLWFTSDFGQVPRRDLFKFLLRLVLRILVVVIWHPLLVQLSFLTPWLCLCPYCSVLVHHLFLCCFSCPCSWTSDSLSVWFLWTAMSVASPIVYDRVQCCSNYVGSSIAVQSTPRTLQSFQLLRNLQHVHSNSSSWVCFLHLDSHTRAATEVHMIANHIRSRACLLAPL